MPRRKRNRQERRQILDKETAEIDGLVERVQAEAPAKGTSAVSVLKLRAEAKAAANQRDSGTSASDGDGETGPTTSGRDRFSSLAISKKTLAALRDANFHRMTDIQSAALPHALAGRDVLGAARTGSGKTLAFLIPVVEALYRAKWTFYDGLGALIVTPTRELALQIFTVLRRIGEKHSMSAGLIIGGKNVDEEQDVISRMNILICTPGRLLQHMDETPNFSCDALKVLVLDEADRLLDLGFSAELSAILENLPSERQTLLFSATQTKSVRQLARLSLNDPEFIDVHADSTYVTPENLSAFYLVAPLPDKLRILYSFIKNHLNAKILVFVATRIEVRFVFEAFRRLRPGTPLLELHGRQKQGKRIHVFEAFSNAPRGVLFATDVAARGLDIPEVDWVVQLDCPADMDTYIHRVGRTARYESTGKALLFLMPSELAMMEKLEARRIPLQEIKVNPARQLALTSRLESLMAADPTLGGLAQKAFRSYVRSIHLMGDKDVFDVNEMPLVEYAASLGLSSIPKIKFLKKGSKAKKAKEAKRKAAEAAAAAEDATATSNASASGKQAPGAANDSASDDEDDEDDFLQVKRVIMPSATGADDDDDGDGLAGTKSRAATRRHEEKAERKAIARAIEGMGMGARLKFNEAGEVVGPKAGERVFGEARLDALAARLAESDAIDKKREHDRVREKKLRRKRRKAEEAAEKRHRLAVIRGDVSASGEGSDDGSGSGSGSGFPVGGAYLVTLASHSDDQGSGVSEDDGGDEHGSGVSDGGDAASSDGEAPSRKRRQSRRQRGKGPDESFDNNGDDSEAPKPKRRRKSRR